MPYLFVCSLFFALNRKASSSLVFILTVYFSFYDLQLFILVQSLISSNWLAPATSISKLWAFVAGQKIFYLSDFLSDSYFGCISKYMDEVGMKNQGSKKTCGLQRERKSRKKKKEEAEKRNMGIGTPSDSQPHRQLACHLREDCSVISVENSNKIESNIRCC